MESKQLQFKSRHVDDPNQQVDWDEVDRTLKEVDPDGTLFSDPRFDSLKHALRILGSAAAEKELNQMREHWVAVDALVDSAVDAHYAGFNTSLQNYSQILRLFSESRAQLAALRRTLELAQVRLRPQPEHLKELYRKDLMLKDVHRLLEDVQAAVGVPEKVRKLEEKGEWSLAVSTLFYGCNKVAREELSRVGALRSLKEEFAHLRESLLSTLIAELEKCVYTKSNASTGQQQQQRNGLWATTTTTTPVRGGIWGTPAAAPSTDIFRPGGGSRTAPRIPRRSSLIFDTSLGSNGTPSPTAVVMMTGPMHRRAATYAAGGFGDGHLLDPEVPLNTLVTCVAQLGGVKTALKTIRAHMQLEVREALLDVLQAFPRSQWLSEEGKRSSSLQSGGHHRKRDAAAAATATALMESISSKCVGILRSLARVVQLLAMARSPAATAGLQMLLDGSSRRTTTANLSSSSSSSPSPGRPSSSAPSKPFSAAEGAATAAQECALAWDCIQLECQVVLADLLGAPQPTVKNQRAARRGVFSTGGGGGGGWLASVGGALDADDLHAHSAKSPGEASVLGSGGVNRRAGESSEISFSLSEEVSEPIVPDLEFSAAAQSADASTEAASAAADRLLTTEHELRRLLTSILGGTDGKVELAAAVHQPIIRMSAQCERVLTEVVETGAVVSSPTLAARGGSGAARLSALLHGSWSLGGNTTPTTPTTTTTTSTTTPTKSIASSFPSAGATLSAENGLLKSYLDDFLRLEFLPSVYISTRSRCRAILDAGDALKSRIRLRGNYTPGAAVLPAAVGAVDLVEQVLTWVSSAPPFATHLSGVLENVLARVLEAFQAATEACLGDSIAGKLSKDVRVVQIMAKEPVAPLLGPPLAFFLGANVDAMDSFVSSALAAGFGSSRKGLERELVGRILSVVHSNHSTTAATATATATQKGVRPEMLLLAGGESSKLIQLAALAESADYVADSIHTAATAAAFQPLDNANPMTTTTTSAGILSNNPRRGVWRLPPGGGGGSGAAGGVSSSSATVTNSSGIDRSFTEGLTHAADRFRALAGRCLRVLRLELILLSVHHLQSLPRLASGGPISAAAEEHAASLARVITQLDETMAPYLPTDRRLYVFASLPPAVVQISVSLLPQFSSPIDTACVSRVCRLLSALQPVLCAAGGVGEDPLPVGSADPTKQLEKAKLYYSLLTLNVDALVAAVSQKPRRFSSSEYLTLLAVNVPGRKVSPEQKQQLQGVLTAAGVM